MRRGVRGVLEDQLGAKILESSADGFEVFSLLEQHPPDLLVVDRALPPAGGLDLLRKVQKHGLPIQTVMMGEREAEAVKRAFRLGASAYVLKTDPLEELQVAVRRSIRRESYVSSGLSEELLPPNDLKDASPVNRARRLTERQREVLQLTAVGLTNKEIGEKLDISPRTVEKHRENIQAKLNLRNAVEMAGFAYQNGLLPDREVPA